jgi:hypothetical protein
MCINTGNVILQGLQRLTFNHDQINLASIKETNIFLGIGLWSKKDGLSIGLPVDVIQMLLAAKCLQAQVKEKNHRLQSNVILLIADSMAIHEGANPDKVDQIVKIYKKCLEPWINLLHLSSCHEILLSSELEKKEEFIHTLTKVQENRIAKQLKTNDPDHYAYVHTECAHTLFLNRYYSVGIKLGWICESSKKFICSASPESLTHWDELKFDKWTQKICQNDCTMQFLYARAGLKNTKTAHQTQVSEGPPYTAFAKDRRYIMQVATPITINICSLEKKISSHWRGIAEICNGLIRAGLVDEKLLRGDCIKKSNERATVTNLLNHWINVPTKPVITFTAIEPNSTQSIFGPLTLEDSFKPLVMQVERDKHKHQTCTFL